MAGYSTVMLNASLAGAGAYAPWLSLHTGDPGTTGANELAAGVGGYTRVQTIWGTPAAASISAQQVSINVPSGVTITYWGCWTTSGGTVWGTGGALAAPQTYSVAGTYLLVATMSATG